MATLPNDRIARGLDARDAARRTSRPLPQAMSVRLEPVARIPAGALVEQAAKITETERLVKELVAGAREDILAAGRKAQETWKKRDAIPANLRDNLAREEAQRAAAAIRDRVRSLLDPLVAECGGAHRELVSQRSLNHSRVQALARIGIGSVERANMEQTVAKTGRVGLLTMAQEASAMSADPDPAVRERGLLLSSVVHAEAMARPPAERAFDPSLLVENAHLPEYDQATRAIRLGESALTNISRVSNDFLMGRDNQPRSLARIFDVRDDGSLDDGTEWSS